jgi:acyl dehydratase
MPIDPDKALGAALPSASFVWDADDVILYHLGVGAGGPALDERELRYTFERDLVVLPSFGVIPSFPVASSLADAPGMDFDLALRLHGEQDIELHAVLPISASVVTTGKIAALYDKGKAAVAVVECETRDDAGSLLCVNRFTSFLRGAGGFGGDAGPRSTVMRAERDPDAVVDSPTLPQQALLYRLSGDKNPLHADPSYARVAGFVRPILHGLATYGIVLKAVVDRMLDGDTSRVARYRARFSGVVFPGETVRTSIWRDGDDLLVEVTTADRGEPVLSQTVVSTR